MRFEDGASAQLYFDPATAAQAEVHATCFDVSGIEQPVDEVVIVASEPDGVHPLVVRQLTPGHAVASGLFGAGAYRFEVSAMIDGAATAVWFVRVVA